MISIILYHRASMDPARRWLVNTIGQDIKNVDLENNNLVLTTVNGSAKLLSSGRIVKLLSTYSRDATLVTWDLCKDYDSCFTETHKILYRYLEKKHSVRLPPSPIYRCKDYLYTMWDREVSLDDTDNILQKQLDADSVLVRIMPDQWLHAELIKHLKRIIERSAA